MERIQSFLEIRQGLSLILENLMAKANGLSEILVFRNRHHQESVCLERIYVTSQIEAIQQLQTFVQLMKNFLIQVQAFLPHPREGLLQQFSPDSAFMLLFEASAALLVSLQEHQQANQMCSDFANQ